MSRIRKGRAVDERITRANARHRAPCTRATSAARRRRQCMDLAVTDHAVLRWLERITGIDVRAQVCAEMLAEGRGAAVAAVRGAATIHVAGTDAMLRVVDGKVVTVLHRDGEW